MLVNFVWSCEPIVPSSSGFMTIRSFLSMSFCLFSSLLYTCLYLDLVTSPSCLLHLALRLNPRARLQVEAPQAEGKPDSLSSWRFFFFFFSPAFPTFHFSHTGLDTRTLQVYSGLVELFSDPLLSPQRSLQLLSHPSKCLLVSLGHHSSLSSLPSLPTCVFVPLRG